MFERRNFRKNSLTLFPRSYPVRPNLPNDKINVNEDLNLYPNLYKLEMLMIKALAIASY